MVIAHLVVIQDQVAGRLLRLLRVTGDTTALENRLDVTMELDVLHALREAQTGFILGIPLLAGLVLLLAGQQGRVRDGIKDGIPLLGRRRVAEERWLLAVGVTAAAVVANLSGPELVPGLSHVQHHAVLVEGLKREWHVCGDFREETGVGITVGVEGLTSGR